MATEAAEGKLEEEISKSGKENVNISKEGKHDTIENNCEVLKNKEEETLEIQRQQYRARTNIYYRAIKNLISKTPIWSKREMDTAIFIVRGIYSALMGMIFGSLGLSSFYAWSLHLTLI